RQLVADVIYGDNAVEGVDEVAGHQALRVAGGSARLTQPPAPTVDQPTMPSCAVSDREALQHTLVCTLRDCAS
ncbi:hypothetical protein MKK75_06510, partial [Methylobacterium sp. J-030]|uniref:hypothetical protein n=1 Tax=Methylobacterium sp. J-030 TaxID=2836627 RepID=UPI001FB8E207